MTTRKLPLILLLMTVIISSSFFIQLQPVSANGPTPPSLEIDPHPTTTATVSTQFTIQIWIRNIPNGWRMSAFDFVVTWDPAQMDLVDKPGQTPPGKSWSRLVGIGPSSYYLTSFALTQADYVDFDFAWASLTFHCLAKGSSKIKVGSIDTVFLTDGGPVVPTDPAPFEITCNQVEPAPVGGLVIPTNKLEILTPYLALAGLVVAVSAVIVVKRRD